MYLYIKIKRNFLFFLIALIFFSFVELHHNSSINNISTHKNPIKISINKPVKAETETWIKPVEGTISNTFGNSYRFYNVYRAGHTGIDIKTGVGTPVHAVAKGLVKYVKKKPNMRYGYYIVLEHENGLFTLYGHLQKLNVKINEKVNQGDTIAYTGISGLASYPHLHFEITNRVPIRDGAWGYNYICDRRSDSAINKEKAKKVTLEKMPEFDFLPLNTIQEKFAFPEANEKHIDYFFRMKNHLCIEEPITPITYYNPVKFLPKYEKSIMPEFIKIRRTIRSKVAYNSVKGAKVKNIP